MIAQGNFGTMYYVRNMEKSVDFYKNIIGLTKVSFESPEWTQFELGDGTSLCLHLTDENNTSLSQGGILITKVKKIRELVESLKAKGVEFCMDVKEVHPNAFAADFKDADGNVVSLYEDLSE